MKVDELYEQAIKSRENASKIVNEQKELIEQRMKVLKNTALGGLCAMALSVGVQASGVLNNEIKYSSTLGTQISKTFEPKEVRQELTFDKAKVDEFKSGFLGGNNKNNVAIIDTIKNKFN